MATATTAIPTGTWTVDPAHSSIEFRVKHLGIATVKGRFTEFEGSLTIAEDGSHHATGAIKVASVDTSEAARDEHLRSPDFFDASTHPDIAFTSTALEVEDDAVRVRGDITIHGVTNPIELEGTFGGSEVDPWGNQRVGLDASGELSRGAFEMRFNQALGSGNMMVSDKVKIAVEISAVKAASA
ncbi:MAG: YceI family protein [Actinomycetota bacterium]|nr:YceI family protein [Actinomycetota bacterium]